MKIAAKYEISEHPTFGSGTNFSILKVDPDDATGALLAWDPVAQKPKWRVSRDKMWNGGTAATAGNLVFQGDVDGIFHAHDARDGKELWKYDAKLGIVAAPITYQVGDTQYVSILVGFGGATAIQGSFLKTGWKYNLQPRRMLTFALNKNAKLPDTAPPDFKVKPAIDASLKIDNDAAAKGEALYAKKACIICHGVNLQSPGVPAPDLRESAPAANMATLSAVLKDGLLTQNGMPQFSELSDEEVRSLYMYIRKGAVDASHGVQGNSNTDSNF
jgi:quinohemoprotein ethanol dehydrogenase